MKTIAILACTLITISCASADSRFDRELADLKSAHDKAIAESSDPIHRSYGKSLEQLLRRAVKGNDWDAAHKIIVQLAILPTNAAKELADRWALRASTGYHAKVILREDGTGTHSDYGDFRWQIVGATLFFGSPETAPDKFELPIQDGKLNGVNKIGNRLTLTKQQHP